MIGFATRSRWKIARRVHHQELQQYLRPQEFRCVTVTERLKTEGSRPVSSGRYLLYEGSSGIEACVYFTANGFVYPVLPEGPVPDLSGLKSALNAVHPRLFCIMGTQRDVLHMEAVFSLPPVTTVTYFLMERQVPAVPARPDDDPLVHIRSAGVLDADTIYPVQRLYEIEEVLMNPESFDARVCAQQLRVALNNQLVYIASNQGGVIAKAQTNARGYDWDQIGGVFTRESFRSRGIGRNVMRALLNETDHAERRTCLFVKTHNRAALRMYRSLQYTVRDEFRITYYRNV
ncbi:MAG: GNAT family N-acetyltransferase [Spirochaetaceae bacterium]